MDSGWYKQKKNTDARSNAWLPLKIEDNNRPLYSGHYSRVRISSIVCIQTRATADFPRRGQCSPLGKSTDRFIFSHSKRKTGPPCFI